jgi:glycine cleavage system H protein
MTQQPNNEQLPESLLYSIEHVWVREAGGNCTVGITAHAQEELGEIVFVEIVEEGRMVEKGTSFGSLESIKTVSELFMPMTGRIQTINPALSDNPNLINGDPYGAGWIMTFMADKNADRSALISAAEYRSTIS